MSELVFYTKNQFFNFKTEQTEAGFEFISMSQLLSSQKIESLDSHQQYYIDLSYIVNFIKNNDLHMLNFEQLINSLEENNYFICDKAYEKDAKYLFRYVFDDFRDVETNISENTDEVKPLQETKSSIVKKITDLNETELNLFFSTFDSRLYGHERFKEEFKELVTSFRAFNKLGEHKILSLFLMGDSGVGKTEVARTIHKALGSKTKLAKINFGNYSSHDALNSLIGSPLGYIGSDGGELLKRVNESDVGLILIDEFEKADNAVFNYFLDVLENGKIINSQADEYDANGYIIVFTSNISKENFKTKISPELRSRFDYKGVFNLLTDEDKRKFVHFRVNEIVEKYKKFVSKDIPEKLHDTIVSQIDVSKFSNMRDLNKKIKDTFVACVKS
ncbi:MAG: AAA family ATPase [[Clostridium] spiroforme]|uniref:AAA family ATPase n=2 Tax=Bacillota TaxID=1239 RepID=A0A943I474_9FIRM|nr:AAA family ATPase [Thomasclavelia spiroformis]MBS5588397.1 AAA family ATPase [Thomasclavelia spiroformis]